MNYTVSLEEKHFMENESSKRNMRLHTYFGKASQEQIPVFTSPWSHVSVGDTGLGGTCNFTFYFETASPLC